MPASRPSRSSDSSPISSPSTSSSSSTHPASLVPADRHSPRILELIDLKISKHVIDYVVDAVVETVDFAMARPARHAPETRGMARRPEYAPFTTFVQNVLSRAEVTTPTLLATLVYIDRAKPHLQIALEEWAFERVFLGALIVASKYLNDSTLKNVHWAVCTGVFRKRDIGRVEREMLDVLDFELGITEDDILTHYETLFLAISSPRLRHRLSPYSSGRNHSRSSQARLHKQQQQLQFAPVPELAPSSPGSSESSDASSSPQTPSTGSSSPEPPTRAKPHSRPSEKHEAPDVFNAFQGYPIVLPGTSTHDHSPMMISQ